MRDRSHLYAAVGRPGGQHFGREPSGVLPPRADGDRLPDLYRPGIQRQKHRPPRLPPADAGCGGRAGRAGHRLPAGPHQPLGAGFRQCDRRVPAARGQLYQHDGEVRHRFPHRQGHADDRDDLCPARAGNHSAARRGRLCLAQPPRLLHGRPGALRLCARGGHDRRGAHPALCAGGGGMRRAPADLCAVRAAGLLAGRRCRQPARAGDHKPPRGVLQPQPPPRPDHQPDLRPRRRCSLPVFPRAGRGGRQPGGGLHRRQRGVSVYRRDGKRRRRSAERAHPCARPA